MQSKVFDEVMYTDKPMVVCAPTGSGKTVIFELAIIRQLMNSGKGPSNAKVVYSKLCIRTCRTEGIFSQVGTTTVTTWSDHEGCTIHTNRVHLYIFLIHVVFVVSLAHTKEGRKVRSCFASSVKERGREHVSHVQRACSVMWFKERGK